MLIDYRAIPAINNEEIGAYSVVAFSNVSGVSYAFFVDVKSGYTGVVRRFSLFEFGMEAEHGKKEEDLMEEIIDEIGLEAAITASELNPVFLFKHSTTCPISSAAYREVAGYAETDGAVQSVYLIKVIESRPVSNAISARTGVAHQSPQLILLGSGDVLWSASHYEISKEKIVSAARGDKRE